MQKTKLKLITCKLNNKRQQNNKSPQNKQSSVALSKCLQLKSVQDWKMKDKLKLKLEDKQEYHKIKWLIVLLIT